MNVNISTMLTDEEFALLEVLFTEGPQTVRRSPEAIGLVQKLYAAWADCLGTLEVTENGRIASNMRPQTGLPSLD
ncbi:hypothetical protein U0C82_18645 [Fulvimarina sp. 2208YS6-2-32]|uniref:Uncharacterized protein n=1 Tax=Fulvimarina uroteuthidis TaxID=3098149 RepID=A0ABU5I8J9_9HYPH|nr:hypothetical protein [Fulvimarina sp. 2208YS6-2-32]MDY8111143.1 hypothetical protein [Fulvimarina sp. 2208YS6-2-32]